MNLLTGIVLIIFALCMFRGYRRGFAKSLMSMVSLVASLILVAIVSPYVMEFLEKETPVYAIVKEKCEETFSIEKKSDEQATKSTEENQQDQSKVKTTSQPDSVQVQLIENLALPDVLKNMLKENNTPEKYEELAVKSFNEYVPKFMCDLFMKIISFLATWILVMLLFAALGLVVDVVTKLPLVHGVNQILGLALGFVQATIIVWIGMMFITVFAHTQWGGQMMKMISDSAILKTLYQSNLILEFLQNTVLKIF